MAYSAKKNRTIVGSALALGIAGMALVFWLSRNHADPVSVGLFRVALAFIVMGLCARSFFYLDEVQRQTAQKLGSLGCLIGIAAMLPLVVFLQTHSSWLDTVVQFLFRHPAGPALYFSLGVGIPIMFQAASVAVLSLLGKLSRSSQS